MSNARANSIPGKSKDFFITTLHATGPEDRIFPPVDGMPERMLESMTVIGAASTLFAGPHTPEDGLPAPLAGSASPHMVYFAYSFLGVL
jgi:hypothetical protein